MKKLFLLINILSLPIIVFSCEDHRFMSKRLLENARSVLGHEGVYALLKFYDNMRKQYLNESIYAVTRKYNKSQAESNKNKVISDSFGNLLQNLRSDLKNDINIKQKEQNCFKALLK